MIIYGIIPVLEALKAGRVARIRVGPRHDGRVQQVLTLAASRHVPVDRVDSAALDRASGNRVSIRVSSPSRHRPAISASRARARR